MASQDAVFHGKLMTRCLMQVWLASCVVAPVTGFEKKAVSSCPPVSGGSVPAVNHAVLSAERGVFNDVGHLHCGEWLPDDGWFHATGRDVSSTKMRFASACTLDGYFFTVLVNLSSFTPVDMDCAVFAVPDVCNMTTETCLILLVSAEWFDSGYKLMSRSTEELGQISHIFLRENVDSDTDINSWCFVLNEEIE